MPRRKMQRQRPKLKVSGFTEIPVPPQPSDSEKLKGAGKVLVESPMFWVITYLVILLLTFGQVANRLESNKEFSGGGNYFVGFLTGVFWPAYWPLRAADKLFQPEPKPQAYNFTTTFGTSIYPHYPQCEYSTGVNGWYCK